MDLELQIKDGIVRLTLNRPAERNTLSLELMEELMGAFEAHRDDPEVKCFILSGAGEKIFCAGGDLTAMGGRGFYDDHIGRRKYLELLETMREAGHPIIGAVNGAALGGGFGLMLACDLVVCAESARLGVPEVKVGLFPMMVAALLTRHLGPKRAMELALTGELISAQQALSLGLVNQVVPDAELSAAAESLAAKLGALSAATLRLGREALYTAADMEFKQSLRYLHGMFSINTSLDDAMEGVSAFFDHRRAKFKGR
jgi:enoyl-CoA hydratase